MSNGDLNANFKLPNKPESNYRYMAVFLVSMTILINYMDRVNLSVATPTLMKVLGLSGTQMGVLMSAFYWSYLLMMVPAGFLLNKFGPRLVMGWSVTSWGFVTVLTAAVGNFASFLAVRIGLGITEAPAFPASARVVSVWIPKRERNLSTACFDTSARIGAAVTPPIVAWLIINYGWRMSFVITGAIAVLYGIYFLFAYKEPDEHPLVTESELAYIRQDEVITASGEIETKPIPMMQLFTYRRFLQVSFGYFIFMYVWTTFNSWMPTYLVQARGMSLKEMGIAAMIPYAFAVLCELSGGFAVDKLYQKGIPLSTVRRNTMGLMMVLTAIFIYLTLVATSPYMNIFWLSLCMGTVAITATNIWAVPQDLAPYGQAGGVGGAYSFLGNWGSLLAPMIGGILIDSIWGFNAVFGICLVGSLFCAASYYFMDYSRLEPKKAA